MMQARVRAAHPWHTAQACAGTEFVKEEWRRVPAGFEAEARRTAFLEIKDESTKAAGQAAPVAKPEEVKPPAPAVKKTTARSRKKLVRQAHQPEKDTEPVEV